MWLVLSPSKGISSLKLGEMLGVQQKTACFFVHRASTPAAVAAGRSRSPLERKCTASSPTRQWSRAFGLVAESRTGISARKLSEMPGPPPRRFRHACFGTRTASRCGGAPRKTGRGFPAARVFRRMKPWLQAARRRRAAAPSAARPPSRSQPAAGSGIAAVGVGGGGSSGS